MPCAAYLTVLYAFHLGAAGPVVAAVVGSSNPRFSLFGKLLMCIRYSDRYLQPSAAYDTAYGPA